MNAIELKVSENLSQQQQHTHTQAHSYTDKRQSYMKTRLFHIHMEKYIYLCFISLLRLKKTWPNILWARADADAAAVTYSCEKVKPEKHIMMHFS